MFMRMIYDETLAQAAYLLGCQRTGEAIVVDPMRDVDRYIDLAAKNGLRIVAVAETHIHADFVSGARELAERVGAKVYASGEGGDAWSPRWLHSKEAGGSYDHALLRDGDTFGVGNIEFRAIHTPGHTPEHIALLVTDRGAGATEPIGLLSGDFLFVGDLGRPDLLETAAGQAGAMEPSARTLYHTIEKLRSLPEFVQVWPAHGAGSACGKALGAVPVSTIGYELRFNPAIRAATGEDAFVEFILDGQPEPPLYFATMKRVNRDGPAVLGGVPTPGRVSAADLSGLGAKDGVSIVDTRSWDAFRAGHVPGSLSLPIQKSFCTDAGSLVRETDETYLVADESRLDEIVRDLVRIGLDNIRGWCPSGEVAASDGLATIDEWSVGESVGPLADGSVALLDVRRSSEFGAGHIAGATNIAHTRLADHADEVPRGKKVLINCRSGARSARAASYLKREGFDVANLAGGFLAWEAAGRPVEA